MFSFICAWINSWVNNRKAGDLRRHRAYYDVIVMLRGKSPCPERPHDRAISQIPQCIRQISHNAPFCNRNVHTCAYFVITWCIVGYEKAALWVFCNSTIRRNLQNGITVYYRPAYLDKCIQRHFIRPIDICFGKEMEIVVWDEISSRAHVSYAIHNLVVFTRFLVAKLITRYC